MVTIHFACGHTALSDGKGSPLCIVCREHRITSVEARAPIFRGAVTGPCAEPSNVRPFSGPLKES